jgi:CubicO group peptidase (beta-lactamase class C family)
MKFALVLVAALFASSFATAADYVPPPGDSWATQTPDREGFDQPKLKAAIDFAIANEPKYSPELAKVADIRDLRISIPLQFAEEPFSGPIGPLAPRAPANGIVIRHGYIVAEWGDTHAVDITNSVTKTFLSAVAGVAFDKGMIRSVDDRVIDYVQPTPDFMLAHNQPITWDEMLRQTSGWVGTMWGKPWWADRPGVEPWTELAAGPPPVGQQWKYSDVRANALSLALTYLWKRPVPDVLKQYVMDPIGASSGWHWEGYDNS